MDIRTECMPFVTLPAEKWTAVDGDNSDSPIGTGPTREAAIADLLGQLAEPADAALIKRLQTKLPFAEPFSDLTQSEIAA